MRRESTRAWLVALAAYAACGRYAYDPVAEPLGADAARRGSPDLLELLPNEAANLVGYWRMEGDWLDASRHGNHLVVLDGAPTFSTDAVVGSTCGEFYDDSLVVSNRPSIEVTHLSFSVWFMSDLIQTANSNSAHTLFKFSCPSCPGDPNIDTAFAVAADNTGSIDFSELTNLPAGSIIADRWNHIAGTYSPTGARLYLNGMLVYEDAVAHPALQTAGGDLWIAQRWPNTSPLWNPQYLHGRMEELAIWSSQLADSDLLAIYASQHP